MPAQDRLRQRRPWVSVASPWGRATVAMPGQVLALTHHRMPRRLRHHPKPVRLVLEPGPALEQALARGPEREPGPGQVPRLVAAAVAVAQP